MEDYILMIGINAFLHISRLLRFLYQAKGKRDNFSIRSVKF